MIVKLKISDITIPQGLLPRVLTGTVQEVVERYKEAYELGEQLPPIKVWKRDSQYWLIDGVHRFTALKELGREYIEAELVECKDELDFRVKAIQENIKHGLALSSEEIKENARLLYRAGLKDVKEIARILRRTKSTVYEYVQDLIEEEKESLRRQVLELRESGLKIKEIANRTGLSERHIKRLLEEGDKIPEIGKMSLSLPPAKEAIKLFSEFLEVIDPETKGLAEKWKAFIEARAKERGFEIEGDPVKFLAGLIDEGKAVIEKYADADWSVVEKAVENIGWVKELSAVAKKNWIGRSRKYWEDIKEELEREKEIERLVLETAKAILQDPVYIFSNWNNLAHTIRSKGKENPLLRQTVEGEIRDILLKHSDELLEVYNSIPEMTEEEWEQIADRKMNYDEAVEIAKAHNKRLPYAVWQVWHTKQEALSSPTSLPPSDLAGSQPALSNIQVSDDDWADWNDEDDEVQEKVQEKKQEKKEVKLIPPEEELEIVKERILGDLELITIKYGDETASELFEAIKKEFEEFLKEYRRGGRK